METSHYIGYVALSSFLITWIILIIDGFKVSKLWGFANIFTFSPLIFMIVFYNKYNVKYAIGSLLVFIILSYSSK